MYLGPLYNSTAHIEAVAEKHSGILYVSKFSNCFLTIGFVSIITTSGVILFLTKVLKALPTLIILNFSLFCLSLDKSLSTDGPADTIMNGLFDFLNCSINSFMLL